jgi:hypothetical protein
MRTNIGLARKNLAGEKHANLFRDTVPDEENKVFLTLTLDRRLPTSAENKIKSNFYLNQWQCYDRPSLSRIWTRSHLG